MVDYESLTSIIASINKKCGEDVLIRGSQIREEVLRVTSGVLAYDLMLGGGWPVNQWSEIIGEESSGAVGVDIDRLWVVESNMMEQVYDIIIRALENRAVDMIVLDSLPSLIPSDEAEKAMDEFTMGLGARLTGKFFRKSSKSQRRSLIDEDRPCTGLVINQWREKIGVIWGDNRTTPGGKAKNFHYFARVEVKRDEWLKDKEEIVGQTIKARTIKNKTYRPQQTAVVDFYFTKSNGFTFGDFDTVKDVVNIAIAIGVIPRAGAYYSFKDQKWQGKEALLLAVREDLDLQKELKDAAFGHFGLKTPAE